MTRRRRISRLFIFLQLGLLVRGTNATSSRATGARILADHGDANLVGAAVARTVVDHRTTRSSRHGIDAKLDNLHHQRRRLPSEYVEASRNRASSSSDVSPSQHDSSSTTLSSRINNSLDDPTQATTVVSARFLKQDKKHEKHLEHPPKEEKSFQTAETTEGRGNNYQRVEEDGTEGDNPKDGQGVATEEGDTSNMNLNNETDPVDDPNAAGGGDANEPATEGDAGDSKDKKADEPTDEDPCAGADTCEDCAAKSSTEKDKVCWWDGAACTEATTEERPSEMTTVMCENTPLAPLGTNETDTAPSPSSGTHNDTSGAEGVENDLSAAPSPRSGKDEDKEGNQTSSVSTPEPSPPPQPAPVASTSSPTFQPSKAPVKPEVVVATEPPTQVKETPSPSHAPHKPPVDKRPIPSVNVDDVYGQDETLSGGSTWGIVLGIALLVSVVAFLRRRRSIFAGSGGGSSPRSAQVPYQGVSTNEDDDEWGWDDEPQTVGDVELAASKKLEDESPRPSTRKGMSLGGGATTAAHRSHNSHSLVKTPPHQKKLLTRRSGSRDDSSTVNSMLVPSIVASSPSLIVTSPPPAPTSAPAPPPTRRPDDIFAEMGFAAQPTFQKPASRTFNTTINPSSSTASTGASTISSSGRSPWLQTAASAVPHNPSRPTVSTMAPMPSGSSTIRPQAQPTITSADLLDIPDAGVAGTSGDPHWDDDADLDDLLND